MNYLWGYLIGYGFLFAVILGTGLAYNIASAPPFMIMNEVAVLALGESWCVTGENKAVSNISIPADQIDVMVNSLKEGNIKKICPDIQINAKPHFQKAMMDNFFGLLNNPEFEKLSKTVPTVIAHSFAFCGVAGALKNDYLSDLPMDRIAEGYRKAAEMGVAIEINLCEVRGVTPDLPNSNLLKIYKVAKEQGCKFTFGTDSHSVAELENRIFMPDGLNLANAVVEEMQLTKNDIAEFVREGIEE